MIFETAFGKNDIRGIYGEDISEELFFYTGRGYIRFIAEKTGKLPEQILVTICRDARLSSPSLNEALTKGVLSLGARVIDLGLAPTPIGYYSEVKGINPVITYRSKEMVYLPGGEGCLSVDRDTLGLVTPRHYKITLKSAIYDFNTNKIKNITLNLEGYPAIVIQHEYDHLQGILFFDKIDKNDPYQTLKEIRMI